MSAPSSRVPQDYMAPPDSARWQSTALIVGVAALVIRSRHHRRIPVHANLQV